MRIGVLTAGGDAPGLNAAIRAIGEMALRDGHEVIGIANGWAGLAGDLQGTPLCMADLRGVIGQGGTLLAPHAPTSTIPKSVAISFSRPSPTISACLSPSAATVLS